jgi:hypothetical protein
MKTTLSLKVIVYINFCLILLITNAHAQVSCAKSRAEAVNRVNEQKSAIESARRNGSINDWGNNPESAKNILENYYNGMIVRNELKLPIEVGISKRNNDYLEILIDARGISSVIPDGIASFTINFFDNTSTFIGRNNYSMPICSGKPNAIYPKKPKNVTYINSAKDISYTTTSMTYAIPNIRLLMNTEDSEETRDVSLMAAEKELREREEKERTEKLISELYNPKFMQPECQIERTLTNRELIESSDAIVLASPKDLKNKSDYDNKIAKPIDFKVKKVLKGNSIPPEFTLDGKIINKSDNYYREENDCVFNSYKKGETYLIFLKKVENGLILFWYPKAPVNLKVSGEKDNWVKEVKNELLKIDANNNDKLPK